MRIALFSDIHGNLVSLEAVLADIEREQVDQIICLGDVATLGPQPREVIERLVALGCPCVIGNHDTFLLDPDLSKTYLDAPWFENTVGWCARQLAPADFDFLRSFKPVIELPLGAGATLLCFHGSPHSNTDIILAMTPPTEVDVMLAGYSATVMAGGHTHVQMLRQHKGTMLINVGSVGMPFEQALFVHAPRVLPWAEYTIINWANGVLSVDLRRVSIDWDAVKQAALESSMPEGAGWVKNWITTGENL